MIEWDNLFSMSATISLLSSGTIDQIAAGEVVESPASVVKELVENALDAGAKNIKVEISGGGLQLLRVSDDGCGMNAADCELSLVRHATSKIRESQDLFRLTTMGFRGEALAAIASISRLTLLSAQEGARGTKIEVEGGKVEKVVPSARARGTTIEVKSLFFNVPARKKFQKSSTALSAEIFRMMTTLSLGYPEVSFELISSGRRAFATTGEDLNSRAESVLGAEFSDGAFALEWEEGSLKFQGLIGPPLATRPNRMGQYLFINRRAVSCALIEEGVRAGYGTRLDERRHPLFLLHLEIPGGLVDANVHPQKKEVRLRDERLLYDKIAASVAQALKTPEVVAPVSFTGRPTVAEGLTFQFEEATSQDSLEKSWEEVIGLFGHFLLIAQEENKLTFVDLKAARFRVIYDQLISEKEGAIKKQGLLVPIPVTFDKVEAAMLLSHLEVVEALGFSVRPAGKEIFMMEAIPSYMTESGARAALEELAGALQESIGTSSFEKERLRKLALIAARLAKGKEGYTLEEGKALYTQLQDGCTSLQDPKGQPILKQVSQDEIQALFTNT
ncbi:MAG: DNA mismatch repair protein MutL [Chlamydiae bacterium]|nr:DNA mismatch repair protein MutL [Chlamydiota bacterium]